MAEEVRSTATPRLRFPQFRSDGPWEAKLLGDLCERVVDKVGDVQLTPVSITAGRGYVSQTAKFGRDISGAQYKNYIHLKRGDFAYNKGNSNLYPQGCVYRLREFDEAAASSAFICFRLLEGNAPGFFEGLFHKNAHGRQLTKFLTSGARSDGLLNIRPDDFFSVEFHVPPRSAEQQKVAECLTSLDELIAAQGRKVKTLKTYKRGLMQQLFPSEGEAIPRLRFPEFRDGPEWEIKPLSDVAENLDNKRVPITESERTKGDVPYYGASGVVDYVEGHLFDEDLLCVSEDGANLVARTYPIAFPISGKTWVNNHAHVLRFDDIATQTVVEDYLNSIDLRDFITGMAQPKLNRAMLDTIPVPLPLLVEQEWIAECLSALDSQISSEAKALEALKIHKRGLLQQLFPSSEEI